MRRRDPGVKHCGSHGRLVAALYYENGAAHCAVARRNACRRRRRRPRSGARHHPPRITLAPLGYHLTARGGVETRVAIHGNRVRGFRRSPGDTAAQPIDVTLDRPGYFSGASDLVPAAVGVRRGRVIIAPLWHPSWSAAQWRAFTIVGRERVTVEGRAIAAWKVEERRWPERTLTATWWLLDTPPYMVYGEVPLPDGRIQKLSEVELPVPMR